MSGLYIDPDFDYSPYPLGQYDESGEERAPVEWLRPWDITGGWGADPIFISNIENRFDLNQGAIGDCWFVSGVICVVASRQRLLIDRCIPPGQSFTDRYIGMFRFKFWHFGQWIEVKIDDRLPTVNGQLVYANNVSQPNEFWVPLLEKAFAKVHGGYSVLDQGGVPGDSIVDMTGGISEQLNIDRNAEQDPAQRDKVWNYLQTMMKACSTAACGILSYPQMSAQFKSHRKGHGYSLQPQLDRQKLRPRKLLRSFSGDPVKAGLVEGHAYAIIKVAIVQKQNYYSSGASSTRLICIHNPWGQHEWTGAWSDGSPEWNSVSMDQKQKLGYINKDDGEFWMAFSDFITIYDHIWVIHLQPDPTSAQIAHIENWWQWQKFQISDSFANQPTYSVRLQGLAIISLMQEIERYDTQNTISIQVVRQSDGQPLGDPKTGAQREVVLSIPVPNDSYYIVPQSADPSTDVRFLLRVFAQQISNY